MKRLSIFLLFPVLLFSAAGCKKDDDGNAKAKPVCHISTTTSPNGPVQSYTYNADGTIATMGDGNRLYNYSYSSNTIIITTSNGPRDSITTNAAGKVINYRYNVGAANTKNEAYGYDANGNLAACTTTAPGTLASTATYTYANGDLIKISGSSPTNFTYDASKPAQDGDFLHGIDMISYKGIRITKSQHLVTGLNGVAFSYEYDADGKIAKLISTSGSTSGYYNYTYTCK